MEPGENRRGQNQSPKPTGTDNQQNHRVSPVPTIDANTDGHYTKMDTKLIDLNMKPHRIHGQASNNQVHILSLSTVFALTFVLNASSFHKGFGFGFPWKWHGSIFPSNGGRPYTVFLNE